MASLALVVGVAATACGGDDGGSGSVVADASAAPSARASASAEPSAAVVPAGQPDTSSAPTATAAATAKATATAGGTSAPAPATARPPAAGGPDLDGDGRADVVELLEVAGMGFSFDVTLADGRMTSAPLPAEHVVTEDVAVVGAVDLDRDGRDEVLVRVLRAASGENRVVFRLDGDGVWLVRTPDGAPWELSTSGGMSGPRSWDCTEAAPSAGREVRTRESQREGSAAERPTYAVTTRTWSLQGSAVRLVGDETAGGVDAEQVALDPSTCDR